MTRRATEADFLGEKPDPGGIYDGTVGWGDGSKHYDINRGGTTLVKVRLFDGWTPEEEETDPKRAKGHKILARVAAPLHFIPAPDTQVLVAIPTGRTQIPGAAVIFAAIHDSPPNQYSETAAKLDFGAEVDVVIKARSITLTDYEDRYLHLGPTHGLKIGDGDANGAQMKDNRWTFYATDGAAAPEAKAVLQLSEGAIKILHKDSAGKICNVVMTGGKWAGAGTKFQASFAAGSLGQFAPGQTATTNGIAYSAAGPANILAPSWIVSSV